MKKHKVQEELDEEDEGKKQDFDNDLE